MYYLQGQPGLVFGSLFGAGVFVTACVAGAVSFTQPFHLMERPFLRWQQQQPTLTLFHCLCPGT